MNMLLFDAGNSRCKWVWTVQGKWLRQGVLPNTDTAAWQALKVDFLQLGVPQRILVSNVAGGDIAQRLRDLCSLWACPVENIGARLEQCGVRNCYANPAQLGSDRWAALLAAWQHVQGACLVVNCGTATTIDALSSRGEFIGGLILPGIELMQTCLQQNTAQLARASGELRDFPVTTADAVASGALRATIGAIRHQYDLLASKSEVICIASGGAAGNIVPHLGIGVEQLDNLVLHGLQIIGQNGTETSGTEMVA